MNENVHVCVRINNKKRLKVLELLLLLKAQRTTIGPKQAFFFRRTEVEKRETAAYLMGTQHAISLSYDNTKWWLS